MNDLIKKLEDLSEEAKYQGYAHSDNFRETSEHYFGIAEGLDIAIEQIHKHKSSSEENDEVVSVALWAIRRLSNKQHKDFAYDELEEVTGQKWERV